MKLLKTPVLTIALCAFLASTAYADEYDLDFGTSPVNASFNSSNDASDHSITTDTTATDTSNNSANDSGNTTVNTDTAKNTDGQHDNKTTTSSVRNVVTSMSLADNAYQGSTGMNSVNSAGSVTDNAVNIYASTDTSSMITTETGAANLNVNLTNNSTQTLQYSQN